jgi:hypothetical protein
VNIRITLAAISLILTSPAFGQNLVVSGLTADDETRIDALVTPVLLGLKSGQVRKATSDFFQTSAAMAGKQSEVSLFGTQAEGALAIYGKVGECQLTDRINYGTYAQARLYICQHEKFLTRWIFDLVRTSKGWEAGNLRFDDKYKLGLEE